MNDQPNVNHLETDALDALDRALDLRDAERLAFLAELEPPLKSRVEQLLTASQQHSSLDHGPAGVAPELVKGLTLTGGDTEPEMIGRRVGAYQITGVLGSGGMGRVYEAVRADGQFDQTIALKVLRWDIEDDIARARFLRERQTLADLSHAQIPKLLDGGLTSDGLPYLVTEKVDGVPIDAYCAEHELSFRERLELFINTCRVVEAAHQQLVIHRDIKPSNILVDAAGVPRLLDFGVAKLVDEQLPELEGNEPTATRAALTPRFAAPEQIEGGRITLATDVYSLGSLLHHLLLGAPVHSVDNPTLGELLRRVAQDDAATPSAAAETLTVVSAGLGTPSELAGKLRPDLDAILIHASTRAPEARYPTANAFADDLQRFLDHRPILARRATLLGRASKALRRQWRLAIAAGLLVLAIGGGTASTLWQAKRAVSEAELAASEAKRANSVTEMMTEIFDSSVLDSGAPVETAKLLLDRGVERAELQLADQPDLLVELLTNLASSYSHLGLHAESSTTLNQARETEEGRDQPRIPLLVDLSILGAQAESSAYNWKATSRWAQYGSGLIDENPQLALKDKRALLQLEQAVAILEEGQLEAARDLLDSTTPQLRQSALANPELAQRIDSAYAKLFRADENFVEAERLYRIVLERELETAGDGKVTGEYYNNVAVMLRKLDRFDEAEALYRKALAAVVRDLGPASRQAATIRGNIMAVLTSLGRFDDMLALSEETLEFALQSNPEGTWRRANAYESRGRALALVSRCAEAIPFQELAIENYTQSIGATHAWTMSARLSLITYETLAEANRSWQPFEAHRSELLARELNATELSRVNLVLRVLEANGQTERAAGLKSQLDARLAALNQVNEPSN